MCVVCVALGEEGDGGGGGTLRRRPFTPWPGLLGRGSTPWFCNEDRLLRIFPLGTGVSALLTVLSVLFACKVLSLPLHGHTKGGDGVGSPECPRPFLPAWYWCSCQPHSGSAAAGGCRGGRRCPPQLRGRRGRSGLQSRTGRLPEGAIKYGFVLSSQVNLQMF